MTLSEQINQDLKAAMKSGDQVRLTTIRSIRALLIDLSKKGTGPATPEEEIGALLAAAKKRKEAMEMYEQAGRKDLVENERAELQIIQTYLPKQMTEEEAAAMIRDIIAQAGASGQKDFGKVMPAAMKVLKGKIDGGIVQRLVKTGLGD